ncbi:OmpA family protein [Flavobacteriaceae bacterium MHTCC 0001]
MRKFGYIITLLLFSIQVSFSQEDLIAEASKNYNQFSYINAIDVYEDVIEEGYESAELYQKLGNSYYFNADYKNAAKWYEALILLNDKATAPEYFYRYAQSLKGLKHYKKSDAVMKRFYEATGDIDTRGSLYNRQKNYLKEIKLQSGRFDIRPFPYNSKLSDFAPSVLNENTLVFSSSRDSSGLAKYRHNWNREPFLDLYATNKLEDNYSFGELSKVSKKINTRLHESTTAFTKDGSTVYFTRNNLYKRKYKSDSRGVNKLKLFKASIDGEGNWVDIIELPFNSNEYSTAHPALSIDEKTLYFASDRPGSLGESDIFKVAILEDGGYGIPVTLGEDINTEGKETFPFISDKGTLYFSSDGRPGLGGLDVYMAKKKNNGFGKVYNVGEPVNGESDDFTFIINEKTGKGYFASNRDGGKGSDDIYMFNRLRPIKETCAKMVSGVLRDRNTLVPIPNGTVTLLDADNKVVATTKSDEKGFYNSDLECNKRYFVRAEKDGYAVEESMIKASPDEKEVILDFEFGRDLIPYRVGDDLAKTFNLNPIYFDLDKSFIRRDARIELAKIIAIMNQHPSLKIDVRSHTDSRADDDYNDKLSERRAKETIAYLVKNGIDPNRLTGKGYGENLPVNRCVNGADCSDFEFELNRRSEFVVVSQ